MAGISYENSKKESKLRLDIHCHAQKHVSTKNTREVFTKRGRKFPTSTKGVCKFGQN